MSVLINRYSRFIGAKILTVTADNLRSGGIEDICPDAGIYVGFTGVGKEHSFFKGSKKKSVKDFFRKVLNSEEPTEGLKVLVPEKLFIVE